MTRPITTIDLPTLAAWADAGVISDERYIEEMQRREKAEAKRRTGR